MLITLVLARILNFRSKIFVFFIVLDMTCDVVILKLEDIF